MTKELPRPVAAMLRRLTEMSEQDQLAAYEAFRDYLAAGLNAKRDPELDERATALKVMRAVVDHLKFDDPAKLSVKDFDGAPEEVRDGWKSGRVIRAWATWRFARDALAGSQARSTARQRAIRRSVHLDKLKTDDFLSSVRDWLATNPSDNGIVTYDEWAAEENTQLKRGELRMPLSGSIRERLRLTWPNVIAVAKGEKTLGEVERRQRERLKSWSRGEHDFVGHRDIVEISGKPSSTIQRISGLVDFPIPVLIIGGQRYYLRADVVAYFKGESFPKRTRDELRPLYVTSREAAALAGWEQTRWFNLSRDEPERLPEPTARAGGNRLWLRSEVEAWVKAGGNKPMPRTNAKNLPDKKPGAGRK